MSALPDDGDLRRATEWLHLVLNEIERVARMHDDAPGGVVGAGRYNHEREETFDYVGFSRSATLARVEAERAVLRLFERPPSTDSPYFAGALRQAVLLLAHGYRYTAPGWRARWAPQGVEGVTDPVVTSSPEVAELDALSAWQAGEPECDTFWGSKGCDLPGGHPLPHVCKMEDGSAGAVHDGTYARSVVGANSRGQESGLWEDTTTWILSEGTEMPTFGIRGSADA